MYNLKTVWSDDPDLSAYPRPQAVRDSYFPLNGKWDYKIISGDLSYVPSEKDVYDGKIVVPFSPESMLSGVNRTLLAGEILVYRTFFERQKGDVALLHFGAVDYECKVYVNGNFAAYHIGGYTPFECEIQSFTKDGENELVVVVSDPSDTAPISRGKQAVKHGGIWYTPTSGIWQTVWLEYLPEKYIKRLIVKPDFDSKTVSVTAITNTGTKNFYVNNYDGKRVVAKNGTAVLDCSSRIAFPLQFRSSMRRRQSRQLLRPEKVFDRSSQRRQTVFYAQQQALFHDGIARPGILVGRSLHSPVRRGSRL